jgi:hypothetical protein
MGQRFSLATLLLLVAIAAIALASTRSALAGAWNGSAPGIAGLLTAGAAAGAVFGLLLAIWSGAGFLRLSGGIFGGASVGAAAGAQLSVTVDWIVIFTAPIILVSTIMVIAANRRQRLRSRSEPPR